MLVRMRRYFGVGAAWLVATVLSVVIASAAVAGIRDRVVDTPVAIGAPTTTTTVLSRNDVTTTVPDLTTTTSPPTTVAPSSTTEASQTTTTTVVDSTGTTTTVPPATTTTTTTAPPTTTTAAPTNQTYTLTGGTVTLSVGNGEVWVVSAVANAGFDTDIEHAGPNSVEVKFESNNHKSKLKASFDGGELKVDKQEEPHDGDDD